jgi:hypothetical protein
VAARVDILTLLGAAPSSGSGTPLLSAGGTAVGAAIGDPSLEVVQSGGGVAVVATAFLLSLIVAAAGLRLAAAASRRRRG